MKRVFTADVAYAAENPNEVFLTSNEIVNYHESKSVYGLTQHVIDGAEDEMDIVSRITSYVLMNSAITQARPKR